MNNNGQHTIATNAPFSLARRTTTDRPAARSRSPSSPPAHPSARGRGTNSSRQSDESRGEEAGREMEEGRRWIRAVVLVHILVVAPSRRRFIPSPLSSHLLSRPVVARLVVSSVIRSVCRFACSSLIVPPRRSVVVPFLVLFIVPSSRRSVARLVPRPSARPRSPFLDTMGGAFFSFDSEAGKQAEGVAGRGIARGVASMRWARSVAGKQAAGDG